MATNWDKEVDFLVAGTGAAAMAAAISAKRNGLDVLIVEKSTMWGGSTLYSGGGVWIPNNHIMRKKSSDSTEEALEYFKQCVEYTGPASNEARREAFVLNGPRMIKELEGEGIPWVRGTKYPDYYPELPGGKIGRTLEVKPVNVKKLGDWFGKSRSSEMGMPLPVMTDDVYELARAWSSISGFWRGARLVGRSLLGAITGRKLRGMGTGLTARLMLIIKKYNIPVELSTPAKKLVVENGRVVGLEVEHEGKTLRYKANNGVYFGVGGFANNKEWREKYHGIPGWSVANPDDRGDGIVMGEEVGAALDLMDDAWWGAGLPNPDLENRGGFAVWERSMPHSIMVDADGNRYANESESYVDLGHHILENNKKTGTIPTWLVVDQRHIKRYLFSGTLGAKQKYIDRGWLVEADTIEELAKKINVNPEGLKATIEKFNGYAKTGKDLDFKRGDSAYDNYYSDPWLKPNPNLGTIEKGPFRAYYFVPTDLGTKGGLVTDEHARVLDKNGKVIEGFYSGGNTTASVMGRTYPGPGATIGPALTFGWLAGEHAAGKSK
ncbi:MAG: FAD-binding protein [Microbacteriaceae bacterium]|nr:FAD-binding protein [Microbacteriaceae bacterium]